MSAILSAPPSDDEYASVTIKSRFPSSASKTRILNCRSTSTLLTALVCKFCGNDRLSLHEISVSRKCFRSKLRIYCAHCRKNITTSDSSKTVSERGRSYDVYRRAAAAAVLKGTSRQSFLKFFAAFDMPLPSLRDSWDGHIAKVYDDLTG